MSDTATQPPAEPGWTPQLFQDDAGLLTGPAAQALARDYGVSTAICPTDYLFNAVVWAHKQDIGAALHDYIIGGRQNAEQVKAAFETYGAGLRTPPDMLDFASGYGRVGRHVKNVMPGARYTAMDIHPEAVAFMTDRLGLEARQSYNDPQRLVTHRRFDYIFALSFFSHVRREQFVPWLTALHRLLAPGAMLMFTVHGETSHSVVMPMAKAGPDGYGMLETSEQFDISTEHYVHALTYPPFVHAAIAASPGLELVGFEPAAWWKHQDMYVVRARAPAPPLTVWDRTRHQVRRRLGAAKRALLRGSA